MKMLSQRFLLPSPWPCIVMEPWLEESRLSFGNRTLEVLAQESCGRRPPGMTRPDDVAIVNLSSCISPTACHLLCQMSQRTCGPPHLTPHHHYPISLLFIFAHMDPFALDPFFLLHLCLPTPNSYSYLMTQFRCHLFLEAFLDFFPAWQIQFYLGFPCVLLITTFLPSTKLWVSQGQKLWLIHLCVTVSMGA